MRTRGAALAIVTLGLAVSLEAVFFTNQNYTGGVNGYNTDNPTIFGLAVGGLEYPKRFATLTLIVLVGLGLMVANLRRGRAGRRLIAVRTNERAAAAMGISVSGAKIYALVLAGMIAAAGGVLFAFYLPAPDFTNSSSRFHLAHRDSRASAELATSGDRSSPAAISRTPF